MKINQFLEAHYEKESSRKCIGFHLRELDAFLDERDISLVDLAPKEWKEFVNGRGWNPNTQRLSVTAIRSYSKHEGLEVGDLLEGIKPKGKYKPPQRHMTQKNG